MVFRTIRLVLILTAIDCVVGGGGLLPAFVFLAHPCPVINASLAEGVAGWVWSSADTCNVSFKCVAESSCPHALRVTLVTHACASHVVQP
jgi:hypothetical protein